MYTPKLYLLAALLAMPLAACPSNDSSTGDPTTGGAAGGGSDEAVVPASCKVSPDAFVLNQETTSQNGLFAVRITAAAPAPPLKYENNWEVAIVQPGGDAIADATLDDVLPWMPVHQHDGRYPPEITPMGGGAFKVDKINLWMGGGWQVKFTAGVAGQSDLAIVDVCIPD